MLIPIVLLHHNEPKALLQSVKAIAERTKQPYRLFVVDNASPMTEENEAVFRIASSQYSAIVIRNVKNNWVYGFNLAIEHQSWPDSEFYVFSDADIVVPKCKGDTLCWLTYLVNQMKEHRCIGKLGMSLDLFNIEQNPRLKETFAREKLYMGGMKIGPNIIAPVDTTLAIYRRDLFVTRFRFSIGHQALIKPQYYICRTSSEWTSVHLGWDYYPGAIHQYSAAQYWQKALAMSRVGAYTDPAIMAKLGFWKRNLLRGIRSSVRLIFGLRVVILMALYVVTHFPRSLNEIQAEYR
jgi:hypothetical protein